MPPAPFEDEDELVARAQGGDERAFEVLVRRHADGLFAVLARFLGGSEEAEEVTQETFLRAWRGIGGFRGDSRSSRPEDKPLEDKLEEVFGSAIASQEHALADLTFGDLLDACDEGGGQAAPEPGAAG